MKKKIFILGLILLFIGAIYANCSKASTGVIYISSIDEYKNFAINNEAYRGYEDKIIILTEDLDFENKKTPMVQGVFKGVFDGRGHTLKNIRIHKEDYSEDILEYGLFEENEGIIRKIIVESGEVNTDGKTGVICAINRGIIEQCRTELHIFAENVIGGIVGWNEGRGVVRSCANNCSIDDMNPDSDGMIGFGGIVGFLYSGTITDCYSIGKIAPQRENDVGNITAHYYPGEEKYMENCFCLTIEARAGGGDQYCIKSDRFDENDLVKLNKNGDYYVLDELDKFPPKINMYTNIGPIKNLVTSRFKEDNNNLIFDKYLDYIKEIDNLDIEISSGVNRNHDYIDDTMNSSSATNTSVEIIQHDKYISKKINEISTDRFVRNEEIEEGKTNFFGGNNFWLVVSGLFIIILVFIKAIIDGMTNNKKR